jgi:hypothetical protein
MAVRIVKSAGSDGMQLDDRTLEGDFRAAEQACSVKRPWNLAARPMSVIAKEM